MIFCLCVSDEHSLGLSTDGHATGHFRTKTAHGSTTENSGCESEAEAETAVRRGGGGELGIGDRSPADTLDSGAVRTRKSLLRRVRLFDPADTGSRSDSGGSGYHPGGPEGTVQNPSDMRKTHSYSTGWCTAVLVRIHGSRGVGGDIYLVAFPLDQPRPPAGVFVCIFEGPVDDGDGGESRGRIARSRRRSVRLVVVALRPVVAAAISITP